MTLLQIFIPEHFSPADQLDCPWVLRESSGRVLRSGESSPATMPKADTVQVVAPAAKVLLASVKVPASSRQKLAKLLPFAVEEKLMYDPETMHVSAGLRQTDGSLPVAVIDRAWVESVLSALRQAGLRPRELRPETLLPRMQQGVWPVVWNGNGGFVRTGKFSGAPLDGGNLTEPPLALLLAAQEAKLAGQSPNQILLRLQGDHATPDLEQWHARLAVPVKLDKAWDWAAEALRADVGINLLQGEFAPAGSSADWLPRLKPALVLAGMIAILQLGGGGVDWTLLNHEKGKLLADMEASFRQAFPEAKVVVDAPLQMQRNLADLRHAAGQPDSGDFLPLLAKAAPAMAGAKVQSIRYERGTLKLDLQLQNISAADLRSRLAVAGVGAELDNPSARAGDRVKLVLTERRT